MATHKHKGVLNSKGKLRIHPIERAHKNIKVQKYHNAEISGKKAPTVKKANSSTKTKSNEPQVKKCGIGNLFGKTKPVKAFIKKVTGRSRDKEIIINLVSSIQVPIDEDGDIVLDFDGMQQKGVKILKQEVKMIKGDKIERTVGIRINKDIKLFE